MFVSVVMKMGYGPQSQVLECTHRQGQHCFIRLLRLALPEWLVVKNAGFCPSSTCLFVGAQLEIQYDTTVTVDCSWDSLCFLEYGPDFVGGEFVFIDDDADRIIHPR